MTLEINMDNLLDSTLDDLADAPEFKPFPAGTHKVTVTVAQKMIGTHPAFELSMKLVETIEMADATETPSAAGATTSEAFMMDNELGQGNFKKILKSLADHFGAKSNRDLIADVQNAECLVVTKVRTNKDKTQKYTSIVELQVV